MQAVANRERKLYVNDEFTIPLRHRRSVNTLVATQRDGESVRFRVFVIGCFSPLVLAGCSQPDNTPRFRSYDLKVEHPSPYSTFVSISPGTRGASVPRIKELSSGDFNQYLRHMTGCTVKPDATLHPIGNAQTPAGYMVPVACSG